MLNIKKALAYTRSLAGKAGKRLLKLQSGAEIKGFKDAQDVCTTSDLDIEKLIISSLESKFPGHNIFSEEKGFISKDSDYTWVIDPLDGSKEYIRFIQNWVTAIALLHKKEAVLSVVYLPWADQMFSAGKNLGSFLNGGEIKVSREKDLGRSFLAVNPPARILKEEDLVKSFKICKDLTKRAYRVRYCFRNNLYLSYLALGGVEAYLNFGYPPKSIEDIVPGLFIADMAGAEITDLKGEKFDYSKPCQLYVASNGSIHGKLLEIVKGG